MKILRCPTSSSKSTIISSFFSPSCSSSHHRSCARKNIYVAKITWRPISARTWWNAFHSNIRPCSCPKSSHSNVLKLTYDAASLRVNRPTSIIRTWAWRLPLNKHCSKSTWRRNIGRFRVPERWDKIFPFLVQIPFRAVISRAWNISLLTHIYHIMEERLWLHCEL